MTYYYMGDGGSIYTIDDDGIRSGQIPWPITASDELFELMRRKPQSLPISVVERLGWPNN